MATKRHRAVFTPHVVRGVHRLEHAHVNCYLLEEGSSLTLVDAGLPGTWRHLLTALEHLGRRLGDVEALVLTHAHFDHVGMARRLEQERRLVPRVLDADARLARHPYRYAHERMRGVYPVRYPRAIPVLGAMTAAGALWVRGVTSTADLAVGGVDEPLDVPGRPRWIATPGHTNGHAALLLPGADAVLSGDAIVTLDPYTGRTGPQIVAGAATADSAAALDSARAIGDTSVGTLLPGHGAPWRAGAERAAALAVEVGPH